MNVIKKVIFDIGHGGLDTGAIMNGLVEKTINLIVGLEALRYIKENYVVDARVTRDKDISLSENNRIKLVNDFNPHLCVSIHHNAAASIDARGSEVIHAHYDQEDDYLAKDIMNELAKIGMPKRRDFTKLNDSNQDWYYMIRRVWDKDTQAIIVEGGFITNKYDAKLLSNEEFLKAEGRAIAECIARFLRLEAKKMDWEEIIDLCFDEPEKWKKGVNALVTLLKDKSDLGDLEILKFLPEGFIKIYETASRR